MTYPPNHEPPTGGWPPEQPYLGDIDQHWDDAEVGMLQMHNTTQMDSKAGCGGGSLGAPFQLPARTDDPSIREFRCLAGNPEGPWPRDQVKVNTYEASETTRDLAKCRKRGAFGLAVQKIWQGDFGPRSYAKYGKRAGIKGDCSCETMTPVMTPDLVKYLRIDGEAQLETRLTYATGPVTEAVATGSATGYCEIGRFTGLKGGSTESEESIDPDWGEAVDPVQPGPGSVKAAAVALMRNMASNNYMGSKTAYCACIERWANTFIISLTGDATAVVSSGFGTKVDTMVDWERADDYKKEIVKAKAELDIVSGNYTSSWHYEYWSRSGPTEPYSLGLVTDQQESWTSGDASLEWTQMYKTNSIGVLTVLQKQHAKVIWGGEDGTDIYTSTMVNADLRDMARTWLSLGPNVCRLRPGNPLLCPLMSYNEVGGAGLQFADDGGIVDDRDDARWPKAVKAFGTLLGAPLAPTVVVGGSPVRVCYEPYFDPTFIEYNPVPVTVATGARFDPNKYGGFSPIEYATQWTDLLFQRNYALSAQQNYNAVRNRDQVSDATCGDPLVFDGGLATVVIWIEHVMFEKPTHNFARPCGEDRERWDATTIRCGTYDGVDGDGNKKVLFSGADAPYAVNDIVRVCGVAGIDDGFYKVVGTGTGYVMLTADFTWPQPSARATVPARHMTDGEESTGGDAPTTGE